MRQLVCTVMICIVNQQQHLKQSKEDLENLSGEESRHLSPSQYYSSPSDSANPLNNRENIDQENHSGITIIPRLRESKESKQMSKNKSNHRGQGHKAERQEYEIPEQFKKIFTLIEDIVKNILEFKKKDINNKLKFYLAKIEQNLVEIDFNFLDLINNYVENGDIKENSDNFEENINNLIENSEQDESNEQNLFEDQSIQKNKSHNKNKQYLNKLFKKLQNQSYKKITQKQNQVDYVQEEGKELIKDTEQNINIYTLIDEKLKKIQIRKKKSNSKPVKGRASKYENDPLQNDSDYSDIFNKNGFSGDSEDNLVNIDEITQNAEINNQQQLQDLIIDKTINESEIINSTPTPNQKLENVIPEGFELNAKKVVAGQLSTAVIDHEGELKFWSYSHNKSPENVRTFQGYSNGKMSLSERFLCAINDLRALNCYLITNNNVSPKKLKLPTALQGEVNDVSAGQDQICAVSAKSAVICWTYTPKGYLTLYVPNRLRKVGSALRVHTGQNYHCAIGNDAKLICWGFLDGRKYREQFYDRVRQVSLGQQQFCYIKFNGQLECYNTVQGQSEDIPGGFGSDIKQVSVGKGHVCAVKQYGKAKCWNYQEGVIFNKIPQEVSKTKIIDISAGQQHICAINKKSKLSCWPVV